MKFYSKSSLILDQRT